MVRASINDLPAEILVELFLILDDASSIFSLAMTSQHTASVFRGSKDFLLKRLYAKWSFNRYELTVLDYFRPESTLIHASQFDFFERHPHYFDDNFAHYLWRGFAKPDRFLSPTTAHLGFPEFWRLQHTRSKMLSFFSTLSFPSLVKNFVPPILDNFILSFSISLYQLRALHEFPTTLTIKNFYSDVKSDPSLDFPIHKNRWGEDILIDHSICATIPELEQCETRLFSAYLQEHILPSTPALAFLSKFPCNSCEEAACADLLRKSTSNDDMFCGDGHGGEKLNMPFARTLFLEEYGERIYHLYKDFDITLEMKPTLKRDGTPGRPRRIEQTLTVNVQDFRKGEKFRTWQKAQIREAMKRVASEEKKRVAS